MPAAKNTKLVRLKTYNPKKGAVLKKYTLQWKGVFHRIEASRGWYKVPEDLADYLEEVPAQNTVLEGAENEEDFPRAFHVCDSAEQAEIVDKRERRREEERAKPKEPHLAVTDLTTPDLRPKKKLELEPAPAPKKTKVKDPEPEPELEEEDEEEDLEDLDEEEDLEEEEEAELEEETNILEEGDADESEEAATMPGDAPKPAKRPSAAERLAAARAAKAAKKAAKDARKASK